MGLKREDISMSKYIRKTHDEWVIEGRWSFGWDMECYAEDAEDATRLLKEYRANCPGVSFRKRVIRVPNDEKGA